MPKTSTTKVSPADVREYLEILSEISCSFNSNDAKTKRLAELEGEDYIAICERLMKLLRLAEIRLTTEDLTAIQLPDPPRTFTHEYLVHGYTTYLADRIVATEAEFMIQTTEHTQLVAEYRATQKRLNDLAKDRRCDRQKQQKLQGELREVQQKLKEIYAAGAKTTDSFLKWMNLTYARDYRYGHVPLQGPLAPALPKGHTIMKAQVEVVDNEFLHSVHDERISQVIHLCMQINQL